MALKSYVVTNDVKSPVVRVTGDPRNPQEISFKQFRKGDIVNGELKHANNKPAFLLVKGVCVVPLDCIKELITKDVVSHADGETKIKSPVLDGIPKKNSMNTNPKVKYADALLIGGIVGFAGVWLAEKQGWIEGEGKKNRLIGAGAGSLLAMYLVYRSKTEKPAKLTKPIKE